MKILYLITASLIVFIISIYNTKREIKYKLSPKLGFVTFFLEEVLLVSYSVYFLIVYH